MGDSASNPCYDEKQVSIGESYDVSALNTHQLIGYVHPGDGKVKRLWALLTRGVRHNRLPNDDQDNDGHGRNHPARDELAHPGVEFSHDSLSRREVGQEELTEAFETEGELWRHIYLETGRALPDVYEAIEVRVTVEECPGVASRGRAGCGVRGHRRGQCGVDGLHRCGVDSMHRSTRIVSLIVPLWVAQDIPESTRDSLNSHVCAYEGVEECPVSEVGGGMHHLDDAAHERSPKTELEHRDAR